MSEEHILLIDDSAGTRSIARAALEPAGYRVTTATNGAAAALAPEFEQYQLVALDAGIEGVDALLTQRALKADARKSQVVILLLVDESARQERENVDLGLSDGFLLKPFAPAALVHKVETLLEEKRVRDECRDYLRQAALDQVHELVEQEVRQAVDEQARALATSLVEGALGQAAEAARRQIDEQVSALSGEREAELIKQTVEAVAQTAVDKIAEQKVIDAMDEVLKDATEKVVKRQTDQILPKLIRDRLKEQSENMLPREIKVRLDKATEQLVPEISKSLVGSVTEVADKVVPRVARERLPNLLERQVDSVANKLVPPMVQRLAPGEIEAQIAQKVQPLVRDSTRRIAFLAAVLGGLLVAAFVVFCIVLGLLYWRATRATDSSSGPAAAVERTVALAALGAPSDTFSVVGDSFH